MLNKNSTPAAPPRANLQKMVDMGFDKDHLKHFSDAHIQLMVTAWDDFQNRRRNLLERMADRDEDSASLKRERKWMLAEKTNEASAKYEAARKLWENLADWSRHIIKEKVGTPSTFARIRGGLKGGASHLKKKLSGSKQ